MRRIGIVTSSRADYTSWRPILRRIIEDSELDLAVVATGMHLRPGADSLSDIQSDDIEIRYRVAVPPHGDSPGDIARALGQGVAAFAELFTRWRPDLLVVLGDRFDMYAAALASVPFIMPLAHIHGGELSEGAIDDALRHSTTKLAHLHFVATEEYARRVRQLGEEDWRITVSGAPSLDNLASQAVASRAELEEVISLDLTEPPLLVTFHPATIDYENVGAHVGALLAALDAWRGPIVFTAPNVDTGGRVIRDAIHAFISRRADARLVENLGVRRYFGVMAIAKAMLGNSSSGLIEAPSFGLPVVNIGTRQRGRVRGANVIDVEADAHAIRRSLDRAIDPAFRAGLKNMRNPYGDGRAAERIVTALKTVELGPHLCMKRFAEIAA